MIGHARAEARENRSQTQDNQPENNDGDTYDHESNSDHARAAARDSRLADNQDQSESNQSTQDPSSPTHSRAAARDSRLPTDRERSDSDSGTSDTSSSAHQRAAQFFERRLGDQESDESNTDAANEPSPGGFDWLGINDVFDFFGLGPKPDESAGTNKNDENPYSYREVHISELFSSWVDAWNDLEEAIEEDEPMSEALGAFEDAVTEATTERLINELDDFGRAVARNALRAVDGVAAVGELAQQAAEDREAGTGAWSNGWDLNDRAMEQALGEAWSRENQGPSDLENWLADVGDWINSEIDEEEADQWNDQNDAFPFLPDVVPTEEGWWT